VKRALARRADCSAAAQVRPVRADDLNFRPASAVLINVVVGG
jgi:hypothetical protein